MAANLDPQRALREPLSDEALEEILDEDPVEESDADKSAVDREGASFVKRLADEHLRSATQDRRERKTYAKRIFWLVGIWLAMIILLLILQGSLGPWKLFGLSDAVVIAVATTTTASVTALLVLVARYLFQ